MKSPALNSQNKFPFIELSPSSLGPPLSPEFFLRDTVTVAKELLGKGLFIKHSGGSYLCEIAEVEAYLGEGDESSHSFRGLTPRNRSMFEAGGTAYVYLIYGFYHCINVVTEAKGTGAAVLIRAGIPLWGHKQMQTNRKLTGSYQLRNLLSGPGKLTQAMGIDKRLDGKKFDQANFKIVDLGKKLRDSQIESSTRIGISKAKEQKLRFFIKSSPWISK
ncbi:MAG: DNA-3-methyladenine glycosylase [Proteobacteria bacterium]|nr:DNA-3-methyladenine glycosylase [Pseudomonadota bacterium]NDC23412.1 DNA-3-methyladenine glycosylase [Pseudomonadota bacterium]NDD03569.1 DNA-3-methyladenine glycosylase [Pseudomonadota bacterium]NDG25925.1 DNA-3-methyladenine glycosylase [Pseudomonadota bacterium]